ncbi:MAG: helix-hairpin-helix domain-containing protein [Candidatus Hodarchaeota archaeon]
MKIGYNWSVAMVLALPFSWFIAYVLYIRLQILSNPEYLVVSLIVISCGLFLGLLVGGFIADYSKGMPYILVGAQGLLLFLGILEVFITPIQWNSLSGTILLFLYFFLFAVGLLLFTGFLNRLVPSIRRGRVASTVTILALALGSLLSFMWNLAGVFYAPALTAVIILISLVVGVAVRPWRKELQTYLVPGSFGPYLLWWIIYLTVYGLYIYATPSGYRLLFNSLFIPGSTVLSAEMVLLGLSGAILVFLFLPDKLGRKRVFTIASLLLSELVLFGPAQAQIEIAEVVVQVLFIAEIFVLAFIVSVGAWLVWAEIGPVRQKGRRAFLGWGLFGLLLIVVWVMVSASIVAPIPFLVYPIAATLVFMSLLPLMNAIEVLPNERVVEDIDISVDTRQVSRALKDLVVDTSLKSIEEQIEVELEQLLMIKGVTKVYAKALRNAGYETPTLVASANADILASILSVPETTASQIIENAKALAQRTPKKGASRRTFRHKSTKTEKSSKKKKPK